MTGDLNDVAVFVKVVQAGSFSAAARQLGIPTSTASTRVARLEQQLGTTLLQRTTRRLRLTEIGAIYHHHANQGLAQILDAEAAVTATSMVPHGMLRITAPADFGDIILARLVDRLRHEYPALALELVLTDRYIDLVAEGIDIAIRTGELRDSTLIARKLGAVCWATFASPDYLRSAPPLTRPQQLPEHPCLQFTPLGKERWILAKGKNRQTIPMTGQTLANDISAIRAMAAAGLGIALLPIHLCREHAATQQLVRVLPGWQIQTEPIHLVHPRQRFPPTKLKAFLEVAIPELRAWLK